MRPPESFINQPIRGLQTMLRVIATDDPKYPNVIPDGIYGPQTRSAVASFQRNNSIPVTGVTDLTTWEAIVKTYRPALIQVSPAQPIQIHMDAGQVLSLGERNPYLYLVQSMLTVISQTYPTIPAPSINGVLDAETADSLSAFQELTDLPVTGDLDKITWKHLSLLFSLIAKQQLRTDLPL